MVRVMQAESAHCDDSDVGTPLDVDASSISGKTESPKHSIHTQKTKNKIKGNTEYEESYLGIAMQK